VNGVSNSNQGTTSVSYSSYCKVVSCIKKGDQNLFDYKMR
jgi:hypothetical protein